MSTCDAAAATAATAVIAATIATSCPPYLEAHVSFLARRQPPPIVRQRNAGHGGLVALQEGLRARLGVLDHDRAAQRIHNMHAVRMQQIPTGHVACSAASDAATRREGTVDA